MQYRPLGKSGLNVSVLSYGASALGGGIFGDVSEQDAANVVRLALDSGINFLDVSPFYGATKAETVLGKALQGVPRDRYFLCTKTGRYGGADFDFSAERVTRSVDESLKRLQTDYVDVLLCHDIEFVPLTQIIEETLPALRNVQAQGKVRFLGVSGLPLKIFPTLLAQTPLDVVLSYCHYNIQNTGLAGLVPFLRAQGAGVISASPLSMGLLTTQGPPDWHSASPALRDVCRRAALLCQERGSDLAKIALQYAVQTSPADTTLAGTASVAELQRNLQWIAEPLDWNLWADVYALFGSERNRIWSSGLPENN